MPIRWRFLGYTVLGGTLWTGTLVGLGWALGSRWRMGELYASFAGFAVLAALISGILWLLWRRWKAPRGKPFSRTRKAFWAPGPWRTRCANTVRMTCWGARGQ